MRNCGDYLLLSLADARLLNIVKEGKRRVVYGQGESERAWGCVSEADLYDCSTQGPTERDNYPAKVLRHRIHRSAVNRTMIEGSRLPGKISDDATEGKTDAYP